MARAKPVRLVALAEAAARAKPAQEQAAKQGRLAMQERKLPATPTIRALPRRTLRTMRPGTTMRQASGFARRRNRKAADLGAGCWASVSEPFLFYLSDDKPNDVTYTELAEIPLSAKQQIFVAQGCQTYSQYADMLYANPAKSEDNLDVFTTVNFSYGMGTMELLENMLHVDYNGVYKPVTYGKMIRDLNADFWNEWKEVFYGVHGIDGNPQVHPFASLDMLGQVCESAADCGDTNGNVCVVPINGEQKACGAVALDGAECPAGATLAPLASGRTIDRFACLP